MIRDDLPGTIGVFGLGLIGTAITSRLMAAGLTVRGYDPDSECMAHLGDRGGQPLPGWATSARRSGMERGLRHLCCFQH